MEQRRHHETYPNPVIHGFECAEVEERRDWVKVVFRRMDGYRAQYLTVYGRVEDAWRYEVGGRYKMEVTPLSAFVPEERVEDAYSRPYFDPLAHEQCR